MKSKKQLLEAKLRRIIKEELLKEDPDRRNTEKFGENLVELSTIFKQMQLNPFLKDPANAEIAKAYLEMYRQYKAIGKLWKNYP